ncbi:Ribonuclease H domain [Macleaya cordata]|uniref:Ribonuclease H domain n=1 Tax=Macleaya cordata TaxID=56857 RepID=A0A200PSG1_MACCD|nr:Ribonuclease H domain [Macleaya cordata]
MIDKAIPDTDINRQFMLRWSLDSIFMTPQPIVCQWMKPSQGSVIVNIHGSLLDNVAGFGVIIRDDEGKVLAVDAGSLKPKSITVHELHGLEMGLRLAISSDFRSLQVGMDSTTVITYVQQSVVPPWATIPIMQSIRQMIRGLDYFQIQHIYHETNRAADHLASLYPSAEFLEIVLSSFVEDLKKIIFEDKSGKAYYRCIS